MRLTLAEEPEWVSGRNSLGGLNRRIPSRIATTPASSERPHYSGGGVFANAA